MRSVLKAGSQLVFKIRFSLEVGFQTQLININELTFWSRLVQLVLAKELNMRFHFRIFKRTWQLEDILASTALTPFAFVTFTPKHVGVASIHLMKTW
jgi:hypothetical protein